MDVPCPTCGGSTRDIEGARAHRYRCRDCDLVCFIPDREVTAAWVAAVFVVGSLGYLVSVSIGWREILRFLAELIPFSHWRELGGMMLAGILGALGTTATRSSHRLLLAQFGSARPLQAPAEGGARIPLMRALRLGGICRASVYVALLGAAPIVVLYLQTGESMPLIMIPGLALALGFTLAGAARAPCPKCSEAFIPSWSPQRWVDIFRIPACPHCGFRAPIDEEVARSRTTGPQRLLVAVVAVVTLGLAARTAYFGPLRQGAFPVVAAAGARDADLGWQIQDLDGRRIDGESFRGRTLFLHLWSTRNLLSRFQLESIARLRDAVGKQVAFALVSRQSTETLRRFAAERKVQLPLYHLDVQYGDPFLLLDYPTTYIVDAAGRQRFATSAAIDWDTDEAIRFLREVAGQPSGRES